MEEKDIVKFKKPANSDESSALMIVQEVRGERVLVSDLRFSNWKIPPTNIYLFDDLEVVENFSSAVKRAKFKLEALGFETFEGFTKGESWNGWDCPYFTYEQANQILQTYNQLGKIIGRKNNAFYDSLTDSFVFPSNDDESEMFQAVFENGKKFYPVGAFSWIWEMVE